MELKREDTQMAKGVAILGMVMLHLFCRTGELPYEPKVYVGDTPLIYFLGLFGDLCVPTYCFCSGYAQMILWEKEQNAYLKQRFIRLIKFLLNYWIVLIAFSIVGLLFDKTGRIPGSLEAFLGNLLLVRLSYNGSWWFVLTYVFLVFLSPVMMKFAQRFPSWSVFIGSGIIYFISYVLQYAYKIDISNPILSWLYTQVLLIGTSQFSFIVGMLFQKNQIMSKLRSSQVSPVLRNICCILLPIAMFSLHTVEKSLIIAPITGLSTIVCFCILEKPDWLCKAALYLGKHSTNIWLVHMFFYLVLFKNLVFIAKYPLLILLLMLAICIAVSYGINLIYQPIVTLLCKKVLYVESQCNSSRLQ